MRIAALAFGLFLAAFLLHWIIWRISLPRRQTAALLTIFLVTLPAGLAAVTLVPALQSFGPIGFWEVFHVSTFHVAMSLAYIVAYSLVEQRSPSMTLAAFVADAQGKGRTREELVSMLNATPPVEGRLAAMVRDRMVVQSEEGLIELTPKGWAWARVFSTWLRMLGMERGG